MSRCHEFDTATPGAKQALDPTSKRTLGCRDNLMMTTTVRLSCSADESQNETPLPQLKLHSNFDQ